MPLGISRINAPHSSHPTPHIAFIKPLPGPGAQRAERLLARVAAIVHPILAQHHLAVMTLEEFEPNREFLGRNFNAGEVIQLVLRRRLSTGAISKNGAHAGYAVSGPPNGAVSTSRTGLHTIATTPSGAGADPTPVFLPFRHVVMVMLHELAHCVHMHHRKAFWQVRDSYATEMRALWARGYTGEGLWGRGQALDSAELQDSPIGLGDGLPAEICGGVYRRRRRGRKRKRGASGADGEPLTYAERQQRRIRRKFGTGGVSLGDDAAARAELEHGAAKSIKGKGKPRIAQSARGRELRAQAALARLGQGIGGTGSVKSESSMTIQHETRQLHLPFKAESPAPSIKSEETDDTASISASSTDSDGDPAPPATEEDGTPLRDASGHDLVRVCPDTGAEAQEDAGHVKAERQELRDLYAIPAAPVSPPHSPPAVSKPQSRPSKPRSHPSPPTTAPPRPAEAPAAAPAPDPVSGDRSCPTCSLANPTLQAICGACGCVLRPEKVPDHWRCERVGCAGGAYVNAGDYGVCGVCGGKRG